ncbi:helix-turn-helix domain-containing protein [Bradyrhizobium sp. AUGA SZCCT0169]|uniref:excisionase family DNA-binding protein n=1 Tax=Bradyrhizobium sp. AUGA SZCCT0169 TaxID=2807663 RepID=UPI001BA747E8|nr:helix-turn-helix domain-containing protein [Bradyrhizobium sp. AUGA SZCCT0169]
MESTRNTQEARPDVLTVEEWAAKMRISRSAAYDAVKNGDVAVIRIGRLIRIPNREVA